MPADDNISERFYLQERVQTRKLRLAGQPNQDVNAIRVLVASDCPIFLDAMHALLRTHADIKIIGEALNYQKTMYLVQELKPSLLLLDWVLSQQDEMRILQELTATALPMRTLLVTVYPDYGKILRALQFGAWGVVMRTSTTQMLVEGIRKVMAGQYWLGHESVGSLVDALRELMQPAREESARLKYGLTPREFEIIAAVVAGYSNLDIAVKFSLSEHTVKHHITNIFDKLGVSNRLELVLFAVNHKLPSVSI